MSTISQMYAARLICGDINMAGLLDYRFCDFLDKFDRVRPGGSSSMPDLDVLSSLIVIWELHTGLPAMCK